MTQRLYYDDPYRTEFSARVTECVPGDGGFCVRLDQSAFYPTSGGQPYDTGTIADKNVLDVFVDDSGDVVHVLDGALDVGETVSGRIDWPRRFDHMQQHAGEHLLANAFFRHLNGHTIGLHLGKEFSTIDVELPGGDTRLPAQTLSAIERDVNERIQRNVSIRCFFPAPDVLEKLPLRKPPAVREHVRVVAIGDFEYCACGGTHPRSTGEIALVKILDACPSKGKLRVSFVCGMRAWLDYADRFSLGNRAANALSTGVENLPEAVSRLQEKLREVQHELGAARREALFGRVGEMLEQAACAGNVRVVCAEVQADPMLLRELASKLTAGDRKSVV